MSERLKVMLIQTRLNIGGVSHQAILLGDGLRARGCEVRLVCGRESPCEGNMFDMAASHGVEVIRVPALRRIVSPLADLRAFFALWRLLRRERPHVVQTSMAKAGQLGRLAARLSGVPVVIHVFHGHVLHSYFDSLSTRLIAVLERWMSYLSDAIVTLTDNLRRELAAYRIAAEEDIYVIPTAMDFSTLQENAHLHGQLRAELGLTPDTPLIGMVGRLAPVKNPHMFLDAARLVREMYPSAHFILVGDGELRDEAEAHARRLGLQEAVTFTGWRDDLPCIYADLDVLVICSLNEGSPVSVLEAMAAGVPVVATRVGGVPNLLADGQTGYLIESNDTAGLAEAIRRVFERPDEAQKMAQAARRALDGRFSVKGHVESYLALYRAILTRKGVDISMMDSVMNVEPVFQTTSSRIEAAS